MNDEKRSCEAVVIGVSAGGLYALSDLLPRLPGGFPAPVAIVQHVMASADDYLARSLDEKCALSVKLADDKEEVEAGKIYIAPPNYHLLIEATKTFSLSVDAPVCHARPSIDVLFDTAAEAYGSALIGVVLTGASADGSQGLKKIKRYGGHAIVQDPAGAESARMPQAAIDAAKPDRIAPLEEIADILMSLCTEK